MVTGEFIIYATKVKETGHEGHVKFALKHHYEEKHLILLISTVVVLLVLDLRYFRNW